TVGAPMQLEDLLAEFGLEPLTKVATQQRVIAIPISLFVERDEQQLIGLDGIEHLTARSPPGDRPAKRRGKPVEDRDPQHELDEIARQPIQHFSEIGANGTQCAREPLYIPLRILPRLAEHSCDNPQDGWPAFRFGM